MSNWPCRCGHERDDHLSTYRVCVLCSCRQYLPNWPGFMTDPEDCAECLRLQDVPCERHGGKSKLLAKMLAKRPSVGQGVYEEPKP